MARWRGLKALVHDAVDATTHLVDAGQASAGRLVVAAAGVAQPLQPSVAAVEQLVQAHARLTTRAVRAVNRVVEGLSDAAIDGLVDPSEVEVPIPLRADVIGTAPWIADVSLAILNAAMGSKLTARGSPLDLGLRLRWGDGWLDPTAPGPAPSRRIAVFVHGLAATEWSWWMSADRALGDPAVGLPNLLSAAGGYTPVLVRYNAGRAVAVNAAALDEALNALVDAWAPEEIVVVAHSMGGLVASRALAVGRQRGHPWPSRVRLLVTLGTPHLGAPLARWTAQLTSTMGALDTPTTVVLHHLLGHLGEGIGDLGAPLPAGALHGVPVLTIAGALTDDPDHPVAAAMGDGMVQVASAHAPAEGVVSSVTLPGVSHTRLQVDRRVWDAVRDALALTDAPAAS